MVVVRTWAGVTAAPAGGLPSQPGPHATSALPAACADFFASSLTFAISLLLEYSDCMLADLAAGAARAAWDPACTTQALPAPPGNVLAAVDARLTPNPQLAEELREVGRLWWGCWVVFRAALLCYGDTPLQALAVQAQQWRRRQAVAGGCKPFSSSALLPRQPATTQAPPAHKHHPHAPCRCLLAAGTAYCCASSPACSKPTVSAPGVSPSKSQIPTGPACK